MTDVADRVSAAEQRIGRWRRRTVLSVVTALALIGAGTAWALTRDDGPWVPPLQQGSVLGSAECGPKVPTREVDDAFGGGGRILTYVEGARCEAVISVENPTKTPVKVLDITLTKRGLIEPLRLVSATRNTKPLSDENCYGCADDFVPFTPITIAPGDEWEIAVQGVMRDCLPPEKDGTYSDRARESLEFRVEVDGKTAPVTVFLDNPWAVRTSGTCNRKY